MACFTLDYIKQLLIFFVEVFAVLALLRLIVSFVAGGSFWPLVAWPPNTGAPAGFVGFIVTALNIVIWAFIMICLIYFVFGLIGCVISMGGGFSFPHPRS